ncbi:hypothetical protein NF867_15675 [Solitalea sp. MAHUQ-68]|uniref:DUF2281 domain-containing protein n=1 Tax=Solitalea agri TaxID=2953739 RepID=A0A9X2F8J0_9SPHI|nr:hypothetical protein [Solitalea agri]MCO4294301.1 hypothetical protein [Solitalea agri]
MIRTIVTPDNQEVSIHVPKNYIGKKIEIIAFVVDETIEESAITDIPVTHVASEKVLAKDWLIAEEEKAWESL